MVQYRVVIMGIGAMSSGIHYGYHIVIKFGVVILTLIPSLNLAFNFSLLVVKPIIRAF